MQVADVLITCLDLYALLLSEQHDSEREIIQEFSPSIKDDLARLKDETESQWEEFQEKLLAACAGASELEEIIKNKDWRM